MKTQLYLKIDEEFIEIEHSTEFCKRLNVTLNSINQKRKRKTLRCSQIFIKGGYYFIKKRDIKNKKIDKNKQINK